MITDDTQMTMWLAESILAASRRAEDEGSVEVWDHLLDPDNLLKRFTREHIRGIGQATREIFHNYTDLEKPWYKAGVSSAGNGTTRRTAPVDLVHLGDLYRVASNSLPSSGT
jgi:ADP-ribosylglycohydrolase